MKARNAKVTAVLLACFLGMTAVGCSGDKETSSKQSDKDSSTAGISAATLPVETDEKGETVTDASGQPVLASGATDFMVKEIEFTWGAKNNTADADTQDPTEAPTAAQANANGQTVTSYVAVTDDGGNKVVDDNGKVVTELVTVPAPQGGDANTGNNGGNTSETTVAGGNNNAATEDNQNAAAPYTPKTDRFQAYWMDMSQNKDIIFNGDFIDITFKVKETTPDGNYILNLATPTNASEFANWDAKALVPAITNGCITVGNATPEAQTATNASDFKLTADSLTAQPGETVTMRIQIADNPGMVAFVLRLDYDSNALEIVDATVGSDCEAALRKGLNS